MPGCKWSMHENFCSSKIEFCLFFRKYKSKGKLRPEKIASMQELNFSLFLKNSENYMVTNHTLCCSYAEFDIQAVCNLGSREINLKKIDFAQFSKNTKNLKKK